MKGKITAKIIMKTYLMMKKKKWEEEYIGQDCYECDLCDNGFINRDDLQRHIERIHGDKHEIADEWQYDCDFCGDIFMNQHDLERQVRRVHDDKLKIDDEWHYDCDLCDDTDSFLNQDDLEYHIERIHYTIQCELCSYRFADDKDLVEQ